MATFSDETFGEWLRDSVADKVISRLKEHRLPAEWMDTLAQGSYRYNLFTKPGTWAAFEITTAGDGESLILHFLNSDNMTVGRFTIWREESSPRADWLTAWAELTGYLQEARNDKVPLSADELLAYAAELKRNALRPIREWIQSKMSTEGDHEADSPS